MKQYLPWILLMAAVLTFAACGGKSGGSSSADSWEPDTNVLSDEGSQNMVSIPAGTGKVGCKDDRVLKSVRKRDLPKIRFRDKEMKAFSIDTYEVTNHNYYLFLQTLDEKTRDKWTPRHQINGVKHPCWHKSGHYDTDKGDFPVTGIPFEAAEAYAQWRGKRLPDEFEWEYAARGKEGLSYGGGTESFAESVKKCNVARRWKSEPTLVAVNAPQNVSDRSPFGVIGMGGNASEWCTTHEVRSFNVRGADGKIVKGDRKKYRLHAFRGPNFKSRKDLECLLSNTPYKNPIPRENDDRYETSLGFRCAK